MTDEAKDETIRRIAVFLGSIGIGATQEAPGDDSFLPGLAVRKGRVVYDRERLAWPGDLLHEAGHIAVSDPAVRSHLDQVGDDPGEEMGAIAWSWAAALASGIAPDVLFHPGGYRGASPAFIANFGAGRYFGVPILASHGMTREPHVARREGRPGYPQMIRWLR